MSGNFNIRKVLVAPLDWGLGHATRDIPLIRALLNKGYKIIVGAEGLQANLLRTEFPEITILPLSGYKVRYSKTRVGFLFKLLIQIPRILGVIRKEHKWLSEMIEKHRIDLVISDNRFGLYSDKVPCVFITHQLTIKAPMHWIENWLQQFNYSFINRFTCCWVPDMQSENNASGILSHPKILPKIPVHYLGLLSRFEQKNTEKKYDLCFLLSGPEPQRTMLEDKICSSLSKINGNILIVLGKPGSKNTRTVPEHVEVFDHLSTEPLQKAIQESEYIICRGGYTSLMELFSLHKKMLLIPTPGQTEQEYLAERLSAFGVCITVSQSELDLPNDIAVLRDFKFKLPSYQYFQEEMIKGLLEQL